ncbi:hypothetical protein M441DRAFT_413331 [Trichoderma asperellum CBS 433.97]|uniref:Uncharacterized protein n=1 Tax=Trichoderma asperellum (strain ATCC 204424 / CBS 433.97 / NBRC 101777) TaxID=1042311 RepID=A0A2T3Z7S2_TRIA4|nr:hypothetical protein M441DRAFT_413331 [Trichoderma asperellum CBS 433.97]PTB40848.1 hypothetical protein M441DRAFT_413331 [Trichoderma asperellum CBS 433.97]
MQHTSTSQPRPVTLPSGEREPQRQLKKPAIISFDVMGILINITCLLSHAIAAVTGLSAGRKAR